MTIHQGDFFDEHTLTKFYKCLREAGLNETEAWACLENMESKGILFREVRPADKTPKYLTRTVPLDERPVL